MTGLESLVEKTAGGGGGLMKSLSKGWQGLAPATQRTIGGAAIGAGLGLGKGLLEGKDDKGETHYLSNMGAGGAIGGAIGRGGKQLGKDVKNIDGAIKDKAAAYVPGTAASKLNAGMRQQMKPLLPKASVPGIPPQPEIKDLGMKLSMWFDAGRMAALRRFGF